MLKARQITINERDARKACHNFIKKGGNVYDFPAGVINAMLKTFRKNSIIDWYVGKAGNRPSQDTTFIVYGKRYDYEIIRIDDITYMKKFYKAGTIGGIIYGVQKVEYYLVH